MMNYAMAAEECSARKYREFAALTQDVGTRAMLETIAAEEDKHLSSLAKAGPVIRLNYLGGVFS